MFRLNHEELRQALQGKQIEEQKRIFTDVLNVFLSDMVNQKFSPGDLAFLLNLVNENKELLTESKIKESLKAIEQQTAKIKYSENHIKNKIIFT